MSAKDDFKNMLRKSGYRATPSRIAILESFRNARRPLSAQGVIDALPHGTDQATVYRALKALKEKGIVRQIDLRHNHAHYELADAQKHHHLVCVRCGRIENVYECGVDDTYARILRHSKHFSEIHEHALEFYGLCKACKEKRS